MFMINVTYLVDLERIDAQLEDHRAFLKMY
jgi:uncharacterized protein YciI